MTDTEKKKAAKRFAMISRHTYRQTEITLSFFRTSRKINTKQSHL